MGKSGLLEHRSSSISQTHKIEEKLLWRAYRNLLTLFRTVPSLTPYGLFFLKIGGSRPPPKTSIAIVLGEGKATDFKFGHYIHRVHPNKRVLKILEKRKHGHIQGLSNFLIIPAIISGTSKATNSKFCTHIHRIDRNKSALKISGKVARDSRKFLGHPHIGRIARSSCGISAFL